MKKALLMLVSFICAVFAVQAETRAVTDLSQLSNDKVYTVRSERAFLMYSSASAVSGQICTNNGSAVGTVTQDPYDVNQQFRIEKSGANYYLFSVGAGKYVDANGNYSATATGVLTLENVGGNYPWKLLIGGNGMNSQIAGQMPAGIVVNGWVQTDPGNCYLIEEVVLGPQEYSIEVLGTDSEAAGVVYEGAEYKNGEKFSTEAVIKKSHFTANAVEGKIAVVTLDGTTV